MIMGVMVVLRIVTIIFILKIHDESTMILRIRMKMRMLRLVSMLALMLVILD